MDPTIASITLRGLLGRRRFLLLLPLPLLVVGLALGASAAGVDAIEWGPTVLVGLGLAVTLPIVALIVGTGVLGSEIDDGTIIHILTKPIPRATIVLTKLLVAIGVTVVTVVPPLVVVGVLAGSARLGLAMGVAAGVGAIAYCAVFVCLSVLTRRPVLIGLAYVLLWEDLLTNVIGGTRVLSIQQYTIALADRIAPTGMLDGAVSLPVTLVMAVLVTAGGAWLASSRLRSFSLAGGATS
jgi:ABC-2 type transport system permease protein